MKSLALLSPQANAGKTVWGVGLLRELRTRGLRVAVFKPISEDEQGHDVPGGCVSLAVLHLNAAAGCESTGLSNPVLLRPTSPRHAEVLLLGKRVGEVSRVGQEAALLEDLGESARARIEEAVLDALERVGQGADLVVVEGAGSATDLSLLGSRDIANVVVPTRVNAALLVTRSSRGGVLAGVVGTLALLTPGVRCKVRGFAANDVRGCFAELTAAARRISVREGVSYLGAIPWLEWFERREQHPPYSQGADEDHEVLGRAIQEHIDMSAILGWLELGNVS